MEDKVTETILRDIFEKKVLPMLLERNLKYGDNNLTRRGVKGIALRTEDKCSRLWNREGVTDDNRDDIEEDLADIAGYGLMGLKYLLGGKL